MGSKYLLLPQIKPYFPRNIGTFYELFGGSAVVSLNVKADKYVINDLSGHLYSLYDMFKNKSADEIISYCWENQQKFGFTCDETRRSVFVEKNKEPYNKCRDYMNSNPSPLGYYFLTFYSFCNQFRFNNGKFNMPAGNGYFKKDCEKPIRDMCEFFSRERVNIFNKSYDYFTEFDDNSFVYMDIPYCNTNAVYNEKREIAGWNEESDRAFFRYCEELNSKGIRWAISNVFCNKNIKNEHLIKWCEDNRWEVHHLNMSYGIHFHDSEYGNYDYNTDEVLICNYVNEDMNCLF